MALAWRLQRGPLFGWSAGLLLAGLLFGNFASQVGDFVEGSQARDVLTALGGEQGITDAYLAAMLGMIGVAVSGYGVQAAMRLHAEESGLHAEPLLALPVGRVRWALGHLTVAVNSTTLLMLVTGASVGLAHAARTGDPGAAGPVLVAAHAQLPAIWVLTGIVMAAFGLAPRLVGLGWAALIGFLLLAEAGPLLDLSPWLMDVSPFAHVPRLPGADFSWPPELWLILVAAALMGAGLAGFRRRDLGR